MAKFLNTSAINYYLEELIKRSTERLILISPFLKLNDRIKELLIDKDRLKIDIRIIYGKSELQPEELAWLKNLTYVRVSFCKNLHAKCYLSEKFCIISSLNLYEFSQVNNNEMGVFISSVEDAQLYKDAYEEAQRLIRISEETPIAVEQVIEESSKTENEENTGKLTSSKLAQKLGMKTNELMDLLVSKQYLEIKENNKHYLTAKGKAAGGEFRNSQKFGYYFLWLDSFNPK